PVPLASLSAIIAYFFFHVSAHPPSLHSFPTRRSSDLGHRSAHGTTSSSTTPTPSPTGPAGAAHPRAGPSTTGSGFPSAHPAAPPDRKSTRLNSSHVKISYAVFCLKKKKYKFSPTPKHQ